MLPLLGVGEPFPPVEQALNEESSLPGLLCVGGDLSLARLTNAYSQGIFPWFSEGQPILWWSPNPRMVVPTRQFKLHPSLRKTIRRWTQSGSHTLHFDQDFSQVIRACANTPRHGQSGTWILPQMIQAYEQLHAAGHAHSVETWHQGRLVGGLYLVNLGSMVFGESMFSHETDASKFALAGLVAFCLSVGIDWIDCQQNTRHLASLGAAPVARKDFAQHLRHTTQRAAPVWRFQHTLWQELLTCKTMSHNTCAFPS